MIRNNSAISSTQPKGSLKNTFVSGRSMNITRCTSDTTFILFSLFSAVIIVGAFFNSPPAAATGSFSDWRAEIRPFGVVDAYANLEYIDGSNLYYGNRLLEDLQVGWVRDGAAKYGGIDWNTVQPEEGSPYLWWVDSPYINVAYSSGINNMVTITPFAEWDQEKCHTATDKKLPCDMDAYRKFIISLVNHYKNQVKYWGIANEVDGGYYWTDTAENYAVLVQETADAIHFVDPDAKIVLGSIATSDFLNDFLTALNQLAPVGKQYFDVADIHYFHLATSLNFDLVGDDLDYKGAKDIYDQLRPVYTSFGYGNAEIWMTETATYSNCPAGVWPCQSEELHAADLVKRLVYPLSYGVSKVFWVTAVEWFDFNGDGPNNYFDNCGLIRNPKHNEGIYRKLAYFTYKKLVEFLAGSNWGLTSVVENSNEEHIYAVQFTTYKNSSRYVFWWDWFDEQDPSITEKDVTLSVNCSKQALVTEAVPPYSSGKEISSYQQAYAASSFVVPVINGQISFRINYSPVLIQCVGQ